MNAKHQILFTRPPFIILRARRVQPEGKSLRQHPVEPSALSNYQATDTRYDSNTIVVYKTLGPKARAYMHSAENK